MAQCTVLKPHTASYADPIRVTKGERVRLTGREELWDGHLWLWAVAEDGRGGWMPDSLIAGNGDRIPADDVFERMQARDLIDDRVPMTAWQRNLSEHAVRENDPSFQLMVESLADLTLYLTDESAYDCRRFESVTQSQGLKRPTVDAHYFDKLFAGMT